MTDLQIWSVMLESTFAMHIYRCSNNGCNILITMIYSQFVCVSSFPQVPSVTHMHQTRPLRRVIRAIMRVAVNADRWSLIGDRCPDEISLVILDYNMRNGGVILGIGFLTYSRCAVILLQPSNVLVGNLLFHYSHFLMAIFFGLGWI